jgi:hypothetical protein
VDPADHRVSLREAIGLANIRSGPDTVVLPEGVFKIALAGDDDTNAAGDFDVTGDTLIIGAGAAATIIDGQQIDREFDVLGTDPSSIEVVLRSLTVRNGSVGADGGGVRVGNAELMVRDCVVVGNRAAGSGGGISNFGRPGTGNVTLIAALVSRNVARGIGGDVCVVGSGGTGSRLTVTATTIQGNISGSTGGRILATALAMSGSTVLDNTALVGAAGGIDAGTVTVSGSTVRGNSVIDDGGGIHAGIVVANNSTITGNRGLVNGRGGISASKATLTRCTVNGNTAAFGGGVSAAAAAVTNSTVCDNLANDKGGGLLCQSLTMINSTVSGNTVLALAGSRGQGGGIFSSSLTLLNVTVTGNGSHAGGGVFLAPGGASDIRNTIVAQSLVDPTGIGPDVSGHFTSAGHNLIGDGTSGAGFTTGFNGDIVGTAADPVDARLGPLASHGGPTWTHAPLTGSPAIDHGDNTGAPAVNQRGRRRIKDGNRDGTSAVDIGAFER